MAYLWLWWLELDAGRRGGEPRAISWQEIESWARLTGRHLARWELEAIRRIDLDYMATMGKAQAALLQSD